LSHQTRRFQKGQLDSTAVQAPPRLQAREAATAEPAVQLASLVRQLARLGLRRAVLGTQGVAAHVGPCESKGLKLGEHIATRREPPSWLGGKSKKQSADAILDTGPADKSGIHFRSTPVWRLSRVNCIQQLYKPHLGVRPVALGLLQARAGHHHVAVQVEFESKI
jgi:hypothetical protein